MAGFQTKQWKNRVSEYGNRRRLTLVSGETDVYDVTREEGTISETGDAFNATNMNDLESRIADVLTIITGTLTAGGTAVTLSDASITTNSILSFYTSIYGVNPETVNLIDGSVTLTFEAQSSDMLVGVKVEGAYSE